MSENPSAVDLDNSTVEQVAAEPVTSETKADPVVPAPGSVLRAAGADPTAQAPDESALAAALAGESEQPLPSEQELADPDDDDEDDEEQWKDPAAEYVDDKSRASILDKDLYLNQVTTGTRDPRKVAAVLRKFYPTQEAQEKAAQDPVSLYNLLMTP